MSLTDCVTSIFSEYFSSFPDKIRYDVIRVVASIFSLKQNKSFNVSFFEQVDCLLLLNAWSDVERVLYKAFKSNGYSFIDLPINYLKNHYYETKWPEYLIKSVQEAYDWQAA